MIGLDVLGDQYHRLPDISGFDESSKLSIAQTNSNKQEIKFRSHSPRSNSLSALNKSDENSRATAGKSELQIKYRARRLERCWSIQVRRKGRRKRRGNLSLGISNKPDAFKLDPISNSLNFCICIALLSTLGLLSLAASAYGLNASSSSLPATFPRSIANLSLESTAIPELSIRLRRSQPSLPASEGEDVLVQTKFGLFKGIQLASHKQRANSDRNHVKVVGFLGIRYASAPVKRLRFMPPTAYHYAPHQVHNMQQFGPICRQRWPFGWFSDSQRYGTMNSSELETQLRLMKGMVPKELFVQSRPLIKQLAQHEQSEDCLNLNIYQPLEARAAEQRENSASPRSLPVLVIIHGESFDYGAGSTINGLKLAEQGQVIVVTFNFRLNILGFPPKLTGASRGNLGLMDQVAALHWIKDNIGSFGGSPTNITLMGTKKGAIFVNLLMLSPLAKGLFHAAIMEDGSALTPFVANHIVGQQSVAAVQHVRLLAKLCDCPLHQPRAGGPRGAGTTANATSTSAGAGQLQQQQQQQPLGVDQQQLQQQQLDETKMNALTFECLRHKPIDQLLLPVPLELLHLSAGQLTIEQRWLRNLTAAGAQMVRAGAEVAIGESPSHHDQAPMMVPVDADLLARLVEQANREQMALLSAGQDPGATSELFSAIYLQQNQVRPLFSPAIDGAIVPGEDLASAMLKPNSLFTQRHLLIGLTQPVLSPVTFTPEDQVGHDEENTLNETNQLYNQFELRPEHMMAELITHQVQQSGLSNEQAVDMVNKFVRSFYRYHNQEITNSIISNYLSRSSHKLMRISKQQETQKSSNQQSLVLLDSLLEAFQDSLTNVPVLKTSLIHASRQLDPMAEVFAARQFERLRLAGITKRPSKSNDTQEILESFALFARSLFDDPNWPLELKSSKRQPSQQLPQAKSTYLYQFDAEILVNDVKRAIQRLPAKHLSNSVWISVREILSGLLIRLQSFEFRHKLGFDYVIRPVETTDDESYIYSLFTNWLTTRLGSTLIQFIKMGKLYQQVEEENQAFDELEASKEKVVQIESKCLAEAQDHHLVQAAAPSEHNHHFTSETCRRDLNALAFNFVINEMAVLNSKRGTKWPIFNLFSQQVATLPPYSTPSGNRWFSSSVFGEDSQYDQQSSLFARSSFWSNFVPALNCSKTQPINPKSLLTNPTAVSALNSSLLHLNLVFSCSLGGKTSYGTIESIAVAVRQSLETKLEQLALVKSDQQQNHHNLRMANMSGLEVDSQQQLANNNQEAAQMTPTDDAGSSTFDIASSNSAIDLSTKAVQSRTKYAGLVLAICGVLLATSIVSGVYAIAKQRKRTRKSAQVTGQTLQQQPDQNGQHVDHSMGSSSSTHSNQHQAAELVQTLKHSPKLSRPVSNHNQHVGPSDEQYLFHNNVGELEDKREAETSFQHISQQPLVCWDHQQAHNRQRSLGGSQQELFNSTSTINMCKSHSMLKISNNGLLITRPPENYIKSEMTSFDNSNNNDDGYPKQQEPIMVPLQGYSINQANEDIYPNAVVRAPSNCTTNGGGYADSSSETQGQTSSVGSISKKRVKISEPIGMGKRNQQQSRAKQNRVETVKSSARLNQDSLYCPMHSDQGSSPADTTPTPTYFIEDTFLQPDNVEWWGNNELNLVDANQMNHSHPLPYHHHHHHHHHQNRHDHQSTYPISSSTRANCDSFIDYSIVDQNDQSGTIFHHQNNTLGTCNRSELNNPSKVNNAKSHNK